MPFPSEPAFFSNERGGLVVHLPLCESRPKSLPRKKPPSDPRPLRPVHSLVNNSQLFSLEVSNPLVSVTEAKLDTDPSSFDVIFTIVYLNMNDHESSEVTEHVFRRTLKQVCWLHDQLLQVSSNVPLPSSNFFIKDLPNSIDCMEPKLVLQLLESKRFQVERFLGRVVDRSCFRCLPSYDIFFSNDEDLHQCSIPQKNIIDKLGHLPSQLLPRSHYKFGHYAICSSGILSEDDAIRFQKRYTYILALEAAFDKTTAAVLRLQASRDSFSLQLSHFGDICINGLHSKYRLGPPLPPEQKSKFKLFDCHIETLATLFDDLKFVANKQGNAETGQFGAILTEYKEIIGSLKNMMNCRTEKLAEYVDALQQMKKKNKSWINQSNVDIKSLENSPSIDPVSKNSLMRLADNFHTSQTNVTKELDTFERNKTPDIKMVLLKFSQMQLGIERRKLDIFQAGVVPILDTVTLSPPSSSASSSSASRPSSALEHHRYFSDSHVDLT